MMMHFLSARLCALTRCCGNYFATSKPACRDSAHTNINLPRCSASTVNTPTHTVSGWSGSVCVQVCINISEHHLIQPALSSTYLTNLRAAKENKYTKGCAWLWVDLLCLQRPLMYYAHTRTQALSSPLSNTINKWVSRCSQRILTHAPAHSAAESRCYGEEVRGKRERKRMSGFKRKWDDQGGSERPREE